MILCSCNVLTLSRLLDAAATIEAADPSLPVTPGRVLRLLGVRPRCGTCLSLIRDILRDAGFAITCPEPLAGIADALDDAGFDTIEVDITIVVDGVALTPAE